MGGRPARHRCVHNAGCLALDSPLSAFFVEVAGDAGASPPRTVTSPPANGGNCTNRGATRRRHADRMLLMVQNPHHYPWRHVPARVERPRSAVIFPMGRILSEERRRERASPMPLHRRRLGPSRGQHVAPYNVRLQSGTPRQGPYDGRSHGAPPRGYSPSSGGYAGSRTGPGMGRKATPHQAADTPLGQARIHPRHDRRASLGPSIRRHPTISLQTASQLHDMAGSS